MNPLFTRPNRWRPITVFSLLVGLLFSLSALAQPAFLKDGLVAYYPFNGNANDESGNGNMGIPNNMAYRIDRFGELSSSALFDGQTSYIYTASNSTLLAPEERTFSVWVYDQTSHNQYVYLIGQAISGSIADGGRLGMNFRGQVNYYSRWGGAEDPKPTPTEIWTHYAGVTSRGRTCVYKNGSLVSFNSDNWVTTAIQNQPLFIGRSPFAEKDGIGYMHFKGGIDDVRIYNRAFTDAEVSALYAYESTPPDNSFITNGLVAYYPLNGSMNDESISKLNAIKSGPSQFELDRFGQSSSALRLIRTGENESGSIDLPNNAETKKQTATYSIWFRPDENVVQSSSSDYFLVILNSGPNYHPLFYRTIDSQSPILRVYPYRLDKTSDVILTPGTWTQISLVVDGNKANIYQDGLLKYTTDQYYDNAQYPVVSIGNLRSYGYHSARGAFDDIRIYNRALLDTEVKALYDYESTPPDNSFITNGLVAYYPFNGNANDESGSGYHGIVYKTEGDKDRFGTSSGSLNFNGIDSNINVPGFQNVSFTNELSFSFWINQNINFDGREHYIISTTTADSFLTSTSRYWGFDVSLMTEQVQKITTGLWVRIFGGIYDQAVSAAKFDYLKPGTWNQVSYSLRGNLAKLYINGVLIGQDWRSEPLQYNLSYKPTSLSIGKSVWRPTQGRDGFFKGQLDELRIYNRALSDTEIKALYDYESEPQKINPRIATANAQVVNGFVVGATITDAGYGYESNPVVTITGGGGTGAKATATQFNGVVTSITITNPGIGYTSAPTITIAPPPFPPRKATSTAQIVNGFVVGTKITDGGFGYDSPPTVLIVGGGGSGAVAVATVANGVVTAITITNPGTGYTSVPIVRIASPPFAPKLGIETSKVYVRMSVVLGRKYQLEASTDLNTWTTTGPAFIAQDEELAQEFDVNQVGRYFRINQVP